MQRSQAESREAHSGEHGYRSAGENDETFDTAREGAGQPI